jgi:membrane-bound lytic murein transglycosylase A
MKETLTLLCLTLGVLLASPVQSSVAQFSQIKPTAYRLPLHIPIKPSPSAVLKPVNIGANLGWDDQIWGSRGQKSPGNLSMSGDSQALLDSIAHSLHYLETGDAIKAYQNYPIREITLDRVRRSLLHFRELVLSSHSPDELQAAVRRDFVFYQSVGNDGRGNVRFTAYYEPVYSASRVQTPVYKYPIYRLPPNFQKWRKPHPKRIELEGRDGLLGNRSKLHGLEMFWFRDRFEAYMVQIQGSAHLTLTDGQMTSVGYAGATNYPWTSIGKELAKDGKLPRSELTLPKVEQYFRQHPQELNVYLPRWQRFVFFKETGDTLPLGSINIPITPERSIATDKSLMPPGALSLLNISLPYYNGNGGLSYHNVNRFALDQDAGSAIKGPGRVDYFMGVGELAGDRAGVTGGNGSIYYLLLKQ